MRMPCTFLQVFEHDVVLVLVALLVRPPDIVVQVERQLPRLCLQCVKGITCRVMSAPCMRSLWRTCVL